MLKKYCDIQSLKEKDSVDWLLESVFNMKNIRWLSSTAIWSKSNS